MYSLIAAMRAFHLAIVIFFTSQVACATEPAFLLRALPSAGSPFEIGRIAIIANMPEEYRERVAAPLARHLHDAFEKTGVEVWSEVQATDPLALKSAVSFSQASLFKPDAYLIVEFAGSQSGFGFGRWNVFNVFLALVGTKGQEIWGGVVTLRRLDEIEDTCEQVAGMVLKKMLDDQAVEFHSRGR